MLPTQGHVLAERYRLDHLIRKKPGRAVFSATDLRLGRPVAVKVRISIETGRHEADCAARLPPNPNTVSVYDYGTDNLFQVSYIVMRNLSGMDLSEFIPRCKPRIPTAEVVKILCQSAQALTVIHRMGMVHCGIEPSHIYLDGDLAEDEMVPTEYVVTLVSFGEAYSLIAEDCPSDGSRRGRYAAPEQLLGKGVTYATDVFSLALVGLEMLIGVYPEWLGTSNIQQPLDASIEWFLQQRSDTPRWLRDVLRCALSIDPRTRFQSAELLRDALNFRDASIHQTAPKTIASPPEEPRVKKDIFEVKPGIAGISVDVRELIRQLRET